MATIITNGNIRQLVSNYIDDKNALPVDLQNVAIGDWNVSNVTNMDRLFWDYETFNEPLNNWDVSNVTSMEQMFWFCRAFNQPLNNWNVSRVENMSDMFRTCRSFNQDLSNWNVSRVENMRAMFDGCRAFNQDLSNWNVSRVRDMEMMFRGCTIFDINPGWQINHRVFIRNMFFETPLQGTVLERAPEEEEEEEEEPAPQVPLAFEVHNAFPQLNFDKFMDIIIRVNNGASNFKDSTYPLQPLITYINSDTSTTFDDTEKTSLTSDLNGEIKRLLNMYLLTHPETKGIVMELIQFVMSQDPDYKDPYIRFLTFDCMNAYGPGGASCTKGVFERVFLINKSVLIPLCSDDTSSAASSAASSTSSCKKVYRELLDCFYTDIDLNAIFMKWYNEFSYDAIPKKENPLTNLSVDERIRYFRIFVRYDDPITITAKIWNNPAFQRKLEKLIQDNNIIFQTLNLDAGLGGRRRKYFGKSFRKTKKTVKRKNSHKLKTFKKRKNRTNKK